jgi:hypothetical protein
MSAAALLALAAVFAFPNEQGTRLLATGEVAKPEALRVALCSGDLQVPVLFEQRQPERRNNSGRQTPQNFDSSAGAAFRLVGARVSPDATCMLAEESLLAGATSLSLKRPSTGTRCSRATYPEFQTDKARPVVGCWPIADSEGVRVAVVEFARRLNQALASLVVVDGERRMYLDYPAEFRGPGADLWRADDGGEIHAEGFEVVFLLKRGSTYLLAIDWAGAEGHALSLHAAEGPGQFTELITDSWYRSPL